MKLKELKEKGILIEKHDLHDSLYQNACGGYVETYYYQNKLYQNYQYNNSLSYNGESGICLVVDDVKHELDTYNNYYWSSLLNQQELKKLKKIVIGGLTLKPSAITKTTI